MISKRAIRWIKYRTFFNNCSLATYTSYDRKTDQICRPNQFFLYAMESQFFVGFGLIFIHSLQLYLKLSKYHGIPEENNEESEADDEEIDEHEFATIVIGWGELAIITTTTLVNVVAVTQMGNVIYLFNAIFAYNQKLTEILETRQIEMDKAHKIAQKKVDVMILGTCVCSTVVGFLVVCALLHPLEPINCIIREWLEVEVDLSLKLVPFLVMLVAPLQGCVNTVIMFALLVECYCAMALEIFQDMTIEGVHKRRGIRCTLETSYYGHLEDDEIIALYRIQRCINERLNEILASVCISFHQVGMLACVSVLLFFFIKFQHVIWGIGTIACAVVLGSMATPLTICFYQSIVFGALVDTTDGFRESGRSIVPRNTMFRRFVLGCQTYYVEEAYPFFHYSKDTFLEFCASSLDNAITLMLW